MSNCHFLSSSFSFPFETTFPLYVRFHLFFFVFLFRSPSLSLCRSVVNRLTHRIVSVCAVDLRLMPSFFSSRLLSFHVFAFLFQPPSTRSRRCRIMTVYQHPTSLLFLPLLLGSRRIDQCVLTRWMGYQKNPWSPHTQLSFHLYADSQHSVDAFRNTTIFATISLPLQDPHSRRQGSSTLNWRQFPLSLTSPLAEPSTSFLSHLHRSPCPSLYHASTYALNPYIFHP